MSAATAGASNPGARPRVLCVDDEPLVIQGIVLNTRRAFDVVGASSGQEGLSALRDKGPFSVVLSDMRMPGMDGATFLAKAREVAPDTTRVLLTGHADAAAAIAAVNRGGIFRFLTKPCPPDELRATLTAACEQHRLVTAERILLEQTLRGCVKTLADILALTSPVAFGRAGRIRRYAGEIAVHLGVADPWALDVAAMLSQLGAITVPEATLARQQKGEPLTPEEQAMLDRTGQVTASLLDNIPRLERVRSILGGGAGTPAGDPGADVALEGKVLQAATDFESLETRGESAPRAVQILQGRKGRYDRRVLDALRALKGQADAAPELREIPLHQLAPGMVLAADLCTTTGVLLMARGFEVTSSSLDRLRNYGHAHVKEPVRVIWLKGS